MTLALPCLASPRLNPCLLVLLQSIQDWLDRQRTIKMTSHTLARFDSSKELSDDCAFCRIIAGQSAAYIVYEDEHNLAFLDILPLRRGHTLVVPKKHVEQVSHLDQQTAAWLSNALVQTTRAVGKGEFHVRTESHAKRGLTGLVSHCLLLANGTALDDERLQVITNQIYAQLVPHVSLICALRWLDWLLS